MHKILHTGSKDIEVSFDVSVSFGISTPLTSSGAATVQMAPQRDSYSHFDTHCCVSIIISTTIKPGLGFTLEFIMDQFETEKNR